MKKNHKEIDPYTLGDVEDIIHVEEREDGSSDGLFEAQDIILPDGSRACSNWEGGLHKKGPVEQLFQETTEPTADELLEIFNKTKEELYPGKTELTRKEEAEVFKRMNNKSEE